MAKRTKWEILQERKMKAWNEYIKLQNEMQGLVGTTFKDGTEGCGSCGAPLPTEAVFAQHYLVDDERYLNIGNCPTRYNNGVLMPPLHSWSSKDLWDEAHELNKTKDKLQAKGTPITFEQWLAAGQPGGKTIDEEELWEAQDRRMVERSIDALTDESVPLTRHICTECGAAYHSDEEEATSCNKCDLAGRARDDMRY